MISLKVSIVRRFSETPIINCNWEVLGSYKLQLDSAALSIPNSQVPEAAWTPEKHDGIILDRYFVNIWVCQWTWPILLANTNRVGQLSGEQVALLYNTGKQKSGCPT